MDQTLIRPLKVMSYNVLAERYCQLNRLHHLIDHPEATKILDWKERLKLIIQRITSYSPDLLCLQEIELSTFLVDFMELFPSYDYYSHEISKQRSNVIGNVILWRPEILSCYRKSFSSCALFTSMTDGSRTFEVCCVHLKAGLRSGVKERVSQITSCLLRLPKGPALITGDFNDAFEGNADVQEVLLTRDYIHHHCGITWSSQDLEGKCFYNAFDHVFSQGITVEVRVNDCTDIIPNLVHGSDHFPIEFTIS